MLINPTRKLKNALVDLIITGTNERKVVMLDLEAREVDTKTILECVNRGLRENMRTIATIERLRKRARKGVSENSKTNAFCLK